MITISYKIVLNLFFTFSFQNNHFSLFGNLGIIMRQNSY